MWTRSADTRGGTRCGSRRPRRARAPRWRAARAARLRRRRRARTTTAPSAVPPGLAGDAGAGDHRRRRLGRADARQRAAQRRRRPRAARGAQPRSAAAPTRRTSAACRSISAARGSTSRSATRWRASPSRPASRRTNADVELDAPIIRFYDAYLDREVGARREGRRVRARSELRGRTTRPAIGRGARAARLRARRRAGLPRPLGPAAATRGARPEFVIRFVLGVRPRLRLERARRSRTGRGVTRESDYLGLGQGDFPVGGYRRPDPRDGRRRRGAAAPPRPTRSSASAGGVIVRAPPTARRAGRVARLARRRHRAARRPQAAARSASSRGSRRQARGDRATRLRRRREGRDGLRRAVLERPDRTRTCSSSPTTRRSSCRGSSTWTASAAARPGARSAAARFAQPPERAEPAATRSTLARARMREMLGRDVPRPRAFAVTNWQARPASAAAPTRTSSSARTSTTSTRSPTPVGGRVLFAGEATNRARHSTRRRRVQHAASARPSGCCAARSVTLSAG